MREAARALEGAVGKVGAAATHGHPLQQHGLVGRRHNQGQQAGCGWCTGLPLAVEQLSLSHRVRGTEVACMCDSDHSMAEGYLQPTPNHSPISGAPQLTGPPIIWWG